jgi:hypothetical protein
LIYSSLTFLSVDGYICGYVDGWYCMIDEYQGDYPTVQFVQLLSALADNEADDDAADKLNALEDEIHHRRETGGKLLFGDGPDELPHDHHVTPQQSAALVPALAATTAAATGVPSIPTSGTNSTTAPQANTPSTSSETKTTAAPAPAKAPTPATTTTAVPAKAPTASSREAPKKALHAESDDDDPVYSDEDEPAVIKQGDSSFTPSPAKTTVASKQGSGGSNLLTPSLAKQAAPSSSAPAVCEGCDAPAVVRCDACHQSLCNDCDHDYHDSGSLKNHKRVPITAPAAAAAPKAVALDDATTKGTAPATSEASKADAKKVEVAKTAVPSKVAAKASPAASKKKGSKSNEDESTIGFSDEDDDDKTEGAEIEFSDGDDDDDDDDLPIVKGPAAAKAPAKVEAKKEEAKQKDEPKKDSAPPVTTTPAVTETPKQAPTTAAPVKVDALSIPKKEEAKHDRHGSGGSPMKVDDSDEDDDEFDIDNLLKGRSAPIRAAKQQGPPTPNTQALVDEWGVGLDSPQVSKIPAPTTPQSTFAATSASSTPLSASTSASTSSSNASTTSSSAPLATLSTSISSAPSTPSTVSSTSSAPATTSTPSSALAVSTSASTTTSSSSSKPDGIKEGVTVTTPTATTPKEASSLEQAKPKEVNTPLASNTIAIPPSSSISATGIITPGGTAFTPGGRKVGFNHDSDDDEVEDDGDPLGIAKVHLFTVIVTYIPHLLPSLHG